MEKGKLCPNCNKDIGFKAIAFAGLPNKIKCPHCKTRIFYKDISKLIIYLILISIIWIALFISLLASFSSYKGLLIGIVLSWILWIPVEILIAYYLRNNNANSGLSSLFFLT